MCKCVLYVINIIVKNKENTQKKKKNGKPKISILFTTYICNNIYSYYIKLLQRKWKTKIVCAKKINCNNTQQVMELFILDFNYILPLRIDRWL